MIKLFCLVGLALLWGCSSEEPFERKQSPQFRLATVLVRAVDQGLPLSLIPETDRAIVIANESVELWGNVYLEDRFLAPDSPERLGLSHFWSYDKDTIPGNQVKRRVTTVDSVLAVFHLVDIYADTLKDSLWILANHPLQAQTLAPLPQSIDVDVSQKDGILFEWSLAGIDSWESVDCYLRLSPRMDVFESIVPISVPCNSPYRLDTNWQDWVDTLGRSDSSWTFYWRLEGNAYNASQPAETADSFSTAIQTFQTFRQGFTGVGLAVPLASNAGPVHSSAYVHVLRADGSVLATLPFDSATQTAKVDSLVATSGTTLLAGDSLRPEFTMKPVAISLKPSTWLRLDTIKILDTTPPRIWPVTRSTKPDEVLRFVGEDLGSGIANSYFYAFHFNATMKTNWSNDTLLVTLPSVTDSLWFGIYGKDQAGNRMDTLWWRQVIQNKMATLTGPWSTKP